MQERIFAGREAKFVSTSALIFTIIGVASCVTQLFKFVEWLDKPQGR